MNKELTEAEMKAIRDGAEKLYPEIACEPTFEKYWETQNRIVRYQRKAHIAALTAERQRSKILVDFIQFVCDFNPDGNPEKLITKASEVLSNYQNKTP